MNWTSFGLELSVFALIVGALHQFAEKIEQWMPQYATKIRNGKRVVTWLIVIAIPALQIISNWKALEADKVTQASKDQTISKLQNQLTQEQKQLRSLTGILNIKFRGAWESDKFPFSSEVVEAYADQVVYAQLSTDIWPNGFKFYGVKQHRFIKKEDGSVLFIVEMALKPGDRGLGMDVDFLTTVRDGTVYLPLVYPGLAVGQIEVLETILDLRVNDRYSVAIRYGNSTGIRSFIKVDDQSKLIPVGLPVDGAMFQWKLLQAQELTQIADSGK